MKSDWVIIFSTISTVERESKESNRLCYQNGHPHLKILFTFSAFLTIPMESPRYCPHPMTVSTWHASHVTWSQNILLLLLLLLLVLLLLLLLCVGLLFISRPMDLRKAHSISPYIHAINASFHLFYLQLPPLAPNIFLCFVNHQEAKFFFLFLSLLSSTFQ